MAAAGANRACPAQGLFSAAQAGELDAARFAHEAPGGQFRAGRFRQDVPDGGHLRRLTGMKGSKAVMAINMDENAPIFEVAGHGAVCDLFEAGWPPR